MGGLKGRAEVPAMATGACRDPEAGKMAANDTEDACFGLAKTSTRVTKTEGEGHVVSVSMRM